MYVVPVLVVQSIVFLGSVARNKREGALYSKPTVYFSSTSCVFSAGPPHLKCSHRSRQAPGLTLRNQEFSYPMKSLGLTMIMWTVAGAESFGR